MSIPAQNVSYLGQGPVAGGSQILAFGGQSVSELSYIGTATFVLDGSASAATLNYTDGVNVLPWVPSAVLIQRIGGNAANTITCYANVATTNVAGTLVSNNATVNFSATGSNTNTYIIAAFILK